MSRCAMTLPMVARRSPATTTPPGKVAATIVVPCGTRSPAPADTFRWVGSTLGATRAAKSENDEVSARRKSAVRPTEEERLLTGRLSGRRSGRTPPHSPPARRRSRPAGSRPLSPAQPCGCCRPVRRLRPRAPRLAWPCVGLVLTRAYPRSSLLSPSLTMSPDRLLLHTTPRAWCSAAAVTPTSTLTSPTQARDLTNEVNLRPGPTTASPLQFEPRRCSVSPKDRARGVSTGLEVADGAPSRSRLVA